MSLLQLSVHIEEWASKIPFRITGHCWSSFKVVVVELSDGHHWGWGEGFPVHYLRETPESLCAQIEAIAPHVERGISREQLLELLPPGGARNAVDSALWDFEAKSSGSTVWEMTGIEPRPLTTTFTVGIEATPEEMAARAIEAAEYPILKIKVDTDRPVERIAAIRCARPEARLVVDANQGWSFLQLQEVAPKLAELDVKLIEQPLPRGQDQALEGYRCPVPLSADESCQHRGELEQAARRYQIINVKLDKTGGLTEALALARSVREKGLELLVSNMGGTSLGMAPAFVVSQLAIYVELDGQLVLKHDRFPGLKCERGILSIPDAKLWG